MDRNRTLGWSVLIVLSAACVASLPPQTEREREELDRLTARATALEARQDAAREQASAAMKLCGKAPEDYKVAMKRVRYLSSDEAIELARLQDRISLLEKRLGRQPSQ